MNSRKAAFTFAPTPAHEAQGVTILRAIGAERMAILDPFLLLDHASIPANSDMVGFPRHPHRGIETLSYVLEGEVGHRDSLGNEGKVSAGGAQWMTAGNGIFHEEMLLPGETGAEFLQLWFSLPQHLKRIPAAYSGAPSETIPHVDAEGVTVRIVAGHFNGMAGPFQDIAVKPTILDVTIESGCRMFIPSTLGDAAVAYVVRGQIMVDDQTVTAPELIVFTDGDSIPLHAGPEGGRLLYVSAKPLYEPILQYRSLVMNTPEDIRESLQMIEAGTFGKNSD